MAIGLVFGLLIRTRRGRRKLARFAGEVAVMIGLLWSVGMLPLSVRHAIGSIAVGVCIGHGVPLLSKRIWKPSR